MKSLFRSSYERNISLQEVREGTESEKGRSEPRKQQSAGESRRGGRGSEEHFIIARHDDPTADGGCSQAETRRCPRNFTQLFPRCAIVKHSNVKQEIRNAEIAQRTKETAPSMQLDNTAPLEYFARLIADFEQRMQFYK